MIYNYSIVVPYRDKYELFLKAVDSIPDREDVQIIIVDNAPLPLLKERLPKKQKAAVVYTTSSPIKGAGAARNVGLKFVEGKFMLFLDADDYYTPEAFPAFDKYLESDYDIIYFKPTSIRLSDGRVSDRHLDLAGKVETFCKSGDDRAIRYRWGAPWSKLIRSEFVKAGGFQFEEIKVNNDAWFSLMTGHNAKKVFADPTEVYVVTEGGAGQSLMKTVTRENAYIRFDAAIRENKFLKSVGRYDMHIRLLGFLRIALVNFGPKEMFRYLRIARENNMGIF